MEKQQKKSFQQYLDELAVTPAQRLRTREDFAFLDTNLIPEELRDEFFQFCAEWKERFEIRNTILGITIPGWYNLTVKACEKVYNTYPDRLQTAINVWAHRCIAIIRADWEETFPGHGDEAQVVAMVKVDKRFGPWIAEVSQPMTSKPLTLVHHRTSNGWCYLQIEIGLSPNRNRTFLTNLAIFS